MLGGEKRWDKTVWIWFAWLAAFFALTARPFLWHVEYFKSPGPQFQTLLLASLPTLAVAIVLYTWVRRKAIWRYEPAIIAGIAGLAAIAYEPRATLVAASMFVACYVTCRAIRRRLELDVEEPAGEIAMSAAAGFALLSYVLFWLGLASLYYPATFGLLIVLPCAVWRSEIPALGRAIHALWRKWAADSELSKPLAGVLVAFGALLAVMTAMVALAPSIVFDSLKMHLTLAATFVRQHSLAPLPLLDYSYFPQGGEVLMAASYALAGQAGARMLAPVFFGLALLLLVDIVRRAGSSRLGALAGATAAIAMPFLHWSWSVAKNDVMLAVYQLAALDAYLRWRASRRFRWLWVGTFFLAASFSVKHVALIGGMALGVLYLAAAWRERRRFLALAALALVLGVFGLCWHARAFWLTGNPVYPERISRGVSLKGTVRPAPPGLEVVRVLTRPWRLLYNGRVFFESPLEHPMGAVLLLSLPAWLLVRRREGSTAERSCLVFIAISLAYWVYHVPGLRYATAPLALLTALTAARLPALGDLGGRWPRVSVAVALGYALLFGVCGAMIVEVNAPQIRYFAGGLGKEGYLREAMRTYKAIEFLRRSAQPGERIFGVGNCSYAYALEPSNMQCFMNFREVYSDADAENVRVRFLLGGFRYLIVPRNEQGNMFMRASAAWLDGVPAYQDAYFAVYRVPLSNLDASHSQQSLQR